MDSQKHPLSLEKIMNFKAELEKHSNDNDIVLQILKRMSELEVNYHDLTESKIGVSLKKLSKVDNKEVSDFAKNLIVKWKKIIKESKATSNASEKPEDAQKPHKELNKPSSESLKAIFNKDHEKNKRNSIKKIILESFFKCPSNGFTEKQFLDKTLEVEGKLFEKFPQLKKYINKGKEIASNISDPKNGEFRKKILEGTIKAEELVEMDVKDMANKEMKAEREQVEKDMFNSLRSDWGDEHAPVFEGMYTCEKCKGKRTSSKEIQMRSADEPMTIFIRCIDCGNEWRIG